ncbi:MAG: inositol monophosphatase family protein [Planctomycetota bacterium]|nr:inositol monophosphatase family protein [Planctomycetota bacterium]
MSDLDIVCNIAKQAGDILLDFSSRLDSEQISSKSSSRDLVTAADLESEQFIVAKLKQYFPESSFWAEEQHSVDDGAEVQWCIDPLDGTVNFVQQLPIYAVSIARLVDKKVDLAVVYLPELKQCFSASTAQATELNGVAVQISEATNLSDAVLATGFPYRRHLLKDNNLENFNRMFHNQRGIRRMGAAAVDLAYVACGKLDAYWELHISPWDVAAGAYLVKRAGGEVDTIVPGGDWLSGGNILAGPTALLSELRQHLLKGRDSTYPDLSEAD